MATKEKTKGTDLQKASPTEVFQRNLPFIAIITFLLVAVSFVLYNQITRDKGSDKPSESPTKTN